ncbi:Uncharacterised protein [Staphylococcus saprophyticus]|uniref:hypothetical protein n=1 Tax=Staphylococcus saprophyticus TaxID=29385 RepID=UPI000E01ED1D|nr:hypothetical protein [Staphylococcus saprophyticus]SUM78686.1 Uncharacterised protein [Staphylococcus saprophyticus]
MKIDLTDFETRTSIRGINRDVLIVALQPETTRFIAKSIKHLKHVYYDLFTDQDRRVFDEQAPVKTVALLK